MMFLRPTKAPIYQGEPGEDSCLSGDRSGTLGRRREQDSQIDIKAANEAGVLCGDSFGDQGVGVQKL